MEDDYTLEIDIIGMRITIPYILKIEDMNVYPEICHSIVQITDYDKLFRNNQIKHVISKANDACKSVEKFVKAKAKKYNIDDTAFWDIIKLICENS